LALFVFVSAGVWLRAGGHASQQPGNPTPKPTPAELKAALAPVSQAYYRSSDQSFTDAVTAFKKLAPAATLQAMLADLYPNADAKDKVVLLAVLNQIGVEHAVKALPAIAADFAVARPKHPNDMSFAGFYVLEKFMGLAWKKLPADKKKGQEGKKSVEKGKDEPKPKPPDEHKPNKVSPDGYAHTGSPADRKAIGQFILAHNLHIEEKKAKAYPIPPAEDTDWVRVVGNLAFVRLHGDSRGVDYIFIYYKGEWSFLADLGHWVN
jgi:hypothetical protein